MEEIPGSTHIIKIDSKRIENLNKLTKNEVEWVIKFFPTKKSLSPDGFTGESNIKYLKKK